MRYIWDRERAQFVNPRDGAPMDIPDRGICAPLIQSDIPAYESPLGNGMIDGRRARREELKRNHCREVDPSEHKMSFVNKSWAKRRGYEVTD